MSRNEAPTPRLKITSGAYFFSAAAMLPAVDLLGQDAIVVVVEMDNAGDEIVVLPWGRITGQIPATTIPLEVSEEDGEIWVRLADETTITAEVNSANQPDTTIPMWYHAKVVEFDCQGFDAVKLEVISVTSQGALWIGAKRRLY